MALIIPLELYAFLFHEKSITFKLNDENFQKCLVITSNYICYDKPYASGR